MGDLTEFEKVIITYLCSLENVLEDIREIMIEVADGTKGLSERVDKCQKSIDDLKLRDGSALRKKVHEWLRNSEK